MSDVYQPINEYIQLSLDIRKSHIDLGKPCLEINEGKTNNHHISRGILAYCLKTTIPYGYNIQLCHACNNDKCSEPCHVYWGTPKENHLDQVACGSYATIKERTVKKHGQEYWDNLHKQTGKTAGAAMKAKGKSNNPLGINQYTPRASWDGR